MTRHMDTDNMCMQTVPLMKELGTMTNNMDTAQKPGWMARTMKASTCSARKTAMGSSNGPIAVNSMENSGKTTLTGKALISGAMEESTQVSGKTIKCMAKDCLSGPMAGSTWESTSMTPRRATGRLNGPMAGSMKAIELMANRREGEFILVVVGKDVKVNGGKAKGFTGFLVSSGNRQELATKTAFSFNHNYTL